MRGSEINNDLLEILDRTDARKSLASLRRATALSRSNVSRLRTNHVFSIEQLTQNLEDVARGGLKIENSLQSLKNINKNDIRIRFLTELVVALDVEKREISKRLNKALSEYRDVEESIAESNGVLTRRRVLAPLTNNTISDNRATNKSTFGGSNDIAPRVSFSPSSFSAPITINTPRSKTRSYIQRNQSIQNQNNNTQSRSNKGNNNNNVTAPKLPEGFLRQSLLLDRDSFRQNREFLQQQTRFQADSQRKIESKLDIIAELLRKAHSGGGNDEGGGFSLPDIDLGDGKKRRGRRAGRARGGGKLGRFGKGLGASLAGGLLSELIGLPDEGDNTGLGSAAGGLLGALLGVPGSIAGSFVGNEIEKYLQGVQKGKINGLGINNKDDPAAKKRLADAMDKITNKDAVGDLPGVNQEAERESPTNSARERFKQLQSNTNTSSFTPTIEITRNDSNDRGMPVNGFRDAFFNVQPEGTVIIKTERLILNGGISGAALSSGLGGDAMHSTDSNFGGMGMGSGGFGGGGPGGSGGGIIGGNTPALIPNVKPGLGQTPSQAQDDARRYLEQSKLPQYNPEMSPNAAAGGGPMQMPDGLGGDAPKSVTDLPFTQVSGAAGSSALKNSNGTTISTFDTNMPAYQRALLDTISRYESNGKGQGYNTTVGGGTFEGNQHPGSFGGVSTAAGRYQFLKGTWDDTVKKYNKEHPDDPITDFSPKNQDRAAYYLAQQDYKRRTGRDLDSDLQNGDYSHIKEGLGGSGVNTTWQGFQGKEGIPGVMEDNLKRNQQYAESSAIKDLDPNAVPNAGVGNTPRAALGDILGEATPGDPNKAMFAVPKEGSRAGAAGTILPEDYSKIKGTSNLARKDADPDYYGDPNSPGFKENNLTTIKLDSGKTVQVNKVAAESYRGFLNELEASGYNINSLGGYANRANVNNPNATSMHAYGTAIDINPAQNPNQPGQTGPGITNLPPNISDMAAKYGLSWGGDWKSLKDTMHFEYAGKMADELKKKAEDARKGIGDTPANTLPGMPEGPSIKGTIDGNKPNTTSPYGEGAPKTLGGLVKAYAAQNGMTPEDVRKMPFPGDSQNDIPMANTPVQNQPTDDYSRNEKGTRNFAFGDQGFFPQSLGKSGYSAVDPTNAFKLPDGSVVYTSSVPAQEPAQTKPIYNLNGIANEGRPITQKELDDMNKTGNYGTTDNLVGTSQTLGSPSDPYSYEDPITGEKHFFSDLAMNKVLSEEKRQAAYDSYMKQGELQPGETFGSWIERRKALGFEESDLRNKSGLGYGEGEAQPAQSYTGSQYGGNQGSLNDGGTSKQDLEDYLNDKYAKSQDPNSFEGGYSKQLDDGYKGSDESRLNRQRYGKKGDEFYTQNPLSLAEIRAFYGPNASTDGISPSISPDAANAMSQSNPEGSTRQSVAPPVKDSSDTGSSSESSDSKKDSSYNSDKKETPSAASAEPVGGGDQEELKKIPVHHDDMGLNALNDKDLAL